MASLMLVCLAGSSTALAETLMRSEQIQRSGTIDQADTIGRSMAELAEALVGEDAEMRKHAQYARITDSLEPFSQALARALADSKRPHFLGMQTPEFRVPRVPGQTDAPYSDFYDDGTETYRGGYFLSYLSRGPLSKDKYDLVPCGISGNSGGPDPQAVPQDVWDGNIIASFLEKQDTPKASGPRKGAGSNSSSPGSKDMVVLLNFAEAGYWGHMMDNGLPRVAIAAKAAKQAGYNLHVLIPPEKVVYGWESLEQVRVMVEDVLGGKLVVPGASQDQLPEHCLEGGRGVRRFCRFFFACGLPSFHEIVRREFYHMVQEALHRHQSLLEVGAENTSAAPRPGLFLVRGSDVNNAKGDDFSPALESRLLATGRWDTASDLGSWPLMKLGAFVRKHRHLMNVEGSGGYHLVWMRGQHDGLSQHASSLSQGGNRATMTELQPTSRVDTCRWLWAHCVGLDYKIVLFEPGERNPEMFFNASLEVMGGQLAQP